MNIQSQSWQDISVAQPLDPRSILANAMFGAAAGSFTRSTNFLQTTWGTNPFAFTGNNTQVVSLDNTDAMSLQDAVQWTFAHQMVNANAALSPALRKVVFMRAGRQWQNLIEIALGASNYANVQLSFRDNLGTSGSFLNGSTGAVPVVSFAGS